MHTIQEEEKVSEIENEMPIINAALENQQADHQTSMVEIQDMIQNKHVSILIDPGASLNYVSPSIAEKCNLSMKRFENSWLVQLATGTKRKVINYVENCELFTSQFKTQVKLNVLPLGSYDVLIGMDWLEIHQMVLNCFEKTFTYLNDKGERITLKWIPRKVSIRKISALQMKKAVRKGCKVFVVHIINNKHMDK